MKCYRVTNWDKRFENNRSRELKKLNWVPVPNFHDGDGYTELLDHPNGPAHYGAWSVLVQVASKCDPRGTLLRDGNRPHDLASLSRMTRVPVDVFKEAVERFIAIHWLELIDVGEPTYVIPHDGAGLSQDDAAMSHPPAVNGREWKEGKELKESSSADAEGATAKPSKQVYTTSFESWYSHYPRKVGKHEASSAFGRAIQRISASRSLSTADAQAWLTDVTRMFADSPAGRAGLFVPHPGTWLNQGRYDDDPQEWNRDRNEPARTTAFTELPDF